jgi:F0F1-type ATP synthase assembly protein I
VMSLVVSAVGVKGLWHQVSRAKLLVAAVVGVTVASGAVFGAIYKAASPLNAVPWALLIWIMLGLAWSYVALRRRAVVTEAETPVARTAAAGE